MRMSLDIIKRISSTGCVNHEVLTLVADAERAARHGEWPAALAAYREAGDCCAKLSLVRGAQRCYRRALEIDLLAADVVDRLIATGVRIGAAAPWERYRDALPWLAPLWPRANARHVQLLSDDRGTVLAHRSVTGPIAHLDIGDALEVTVRCAPDFRAAPDALLLVLLRRALWVKPRELPRAPTKPVTVHLAVAERTYRLFEDGLWTGGHASSCSEQAAPTSNHTPVTVSPLRTAR